MTREAHRDRRATHKRHTESVCESKWMNEWVWQKGKQNRRKKFSSLFGIRNWEEAIGTKDYTHQKISQFHWISQYFNSIIIIDGVFRNSMPNNICLFLFSSFSQIVIQISLSFLSVHHHFIQCTRDDCIHTHNRIIFWLHLYYTFISKLKYCYRYCCYCICSCSIALLSDHLLNTTHWV